MASGSHSHLEICCHLLLFCWFYRYACWTPCGNLTLCWTWQLSYSKALRCTFFEERKNSCSSKFVQLLLLNRMKARWSENCAAQGFHYINSFISNIFEPNSNVHLRGPRRAAWGRVHRGLTVAEFLKNLALEFWKSMVNLIWLLYYAWIVRIL